MKILIIATPRSGSTTLTHTLGKLYDIRVYREPFRKEYKGIKYNPEQDHVLKVMVDQIDTSTFNFSIFDYIIYLTRKNLIEASQSFDYQLEHNLNNPSAWYQPYILNKSSKPTSSYSFLKKNSDKIKKIANFTVYYEELYSRDKKLVLNIFNKIGLSKNFDTFFSLLNSSERYRRYKKDII